MSPRSHPDQPLATQPDTDSAAALDASTLEHVVGGAAVRAGTPVAGRSVPADAHGCPACPHPAAGGFTLCR